MYIVLEIQTRGDGTHVLEPAIYEDKSKALQKYYTVLSYAVISGLPCHAAMVVTHDGMVLKSEYYITEAEGEADEEVPVE